MSDPDSATNMVSRSTQTDLETESTPRKERSFANNPPESDFLEEPLGYTMLDPYGRRSMAYRRKATNEIVTQTELDEESGIEQPMLDYFHRQDAFMCFMLFENVKSSWLRQTLSLLAMLFLMMPWLAYSNLKVGWDVKMEKRRKEAQEGKEK